MPTHCVALSNNDLILVAWTFEHKLAGCLGFDVRRIDTAQVKRGDASPQGTSLPAFWRFDTFAEAKIDQHWTLKLFVNNIFNKLYYNALYQSATPFVLEAPGRTAALMISARF